MTIETTLPNTYLTMNTAVTAAPTSSTPNYSCSTMVEDLVDFLIRRIRFCPHPNQARCLRKIELGGKDVFPANQRQQSYFLYLSQSVRV